MTTPTALPPLCLDIGALQRIVRVQNAVNNQMAGFDWIARVRSGDIDYIECIMDESAELRRCAVPFKFWDKSEFPLDMDNAQMEVVDIFHFALSFQIAEYANNVVVVEGNDDVGSHDVELALNRVASTIEHGFESLHDLPTAFNLKSALRDFNGVLLAADTVGWDLFAQMVYAVGLTPESLFSLYFAKSELNKFRTEMRAAHGTYRKVWANGHEDNHNLMKWARSLPVPPTPEECRDWLHANYNTGE